MSGGGGGSMPTINRPGTNDDCSSLIINTHLASPDMDVVAQHDVGTVLSVNAASPTGPVRVVDSNGNIAGNILSREQVRLLKCLNQGTEFIAEIRSIDEGSSSIQIRPA